MPLFAKFPDVQFIVMPQLESNSPLELDKRLVGLLRKCYEAHPNVQYAHNRMTWQPTKAPLEIHAYNLNSKLKRGDIVSGDGIDTLPTCSYLNDLRRRGIHYMFWRPDWQGASVRGRNRPAHKRTYSMKRNKRIIKRLMRC